MCLSYNLAQYMLYSPTCRNTISGFLFGAFGIIAVELMMMF